MSAGPVEFSALVYGSFVCSLLEMTEDVEEVNKKLDEIGYRIGLRLAHDFARDQSLERIDSAEKVINEVIVKKWAIISGGKSQVNVTKVDENQWTLHFQQSIFTSNVQIPELYSGVHFTGMLPGVLRSIFEVFHIRASVSLADNEGKTGTTVSVQAHEIIPEAIPKSED